MKRNIRWLAIIFLFGLYSCTSISHFDKTAYEQITSVEADALKLMDKAVTEYSANTKEIEEVKGNMQKAYFYDKNRPKNKITAQMWQVIIDPDGQSFGNFIQRWENEKNLRKVFIQEAKKKVQEHFDRIAQLESKKIKS